MNQHRLQGGVFEMEAGSSYGVDCVQLRAGAEELRSQIVVGEAIRMVARVGNVFSNEAKDLIHLALMHPPTYMFHQLVGKLLEHSQTHTLEIPKKRKTELKFTIERKRK